MPKAIVITPGEDANEKKRAARKKKANEKEAKGIEHALSKRMEELREFHDIVVIQEASKKKGKAGNKKERKAYNKEDRKRNKKQGRKQQRRQQRKQQRKRQGQRNSYYWTMN